MIITASQTGPLFVRTDRDKYTPELNQTCLLTDLVFKDKNTTKNMVDSCQKNPLPSKPLSAVILNKYDGMIQQHIERRILFFFQQLIMTYQTKLRFEVVGALDQGQSPDALQYGNSKTKLISRQAAHSATLPCLIAYDLNDSNATGFVFLKGSDYYRSANATMNMPKWVNDADREIDEKRSSSLLRTKALKLINQAAQGLVTPDQGIHIFVQDALDEVRSGQQRLQTGSEVRLVLEKYEALLIRFQKSLASDLSHFLNITIDSSTHDTKAQRTILKMRYAAIRNSQVEQTKLIAKIDKVKKEILGDLKRAKEKTDYFQGAFSIKLIAGARTDDDRHRLEKLLNFSPTDFLSRVAAKDKGQQTKLAKMLHYLDQHFDKISQVTREVLNDMRTLRTQEEYQRAATLKELRNLKSWSQKQLGAIVKKHYPAAAASQPTISRIETRKKLVTSKIATEFSTVFKVDSGLFMPHFFYA